MAETTLVRLRRSYSPDKEAEDIYSSIMSWRVYRPASFFVAVPFIRLGASANQVTLLRYAIMVAAMILFAQGGYVLGLLGSFLNFLHFFLDYVDGNIARLNGTANRLGALLDGIADRVGTIVPSLFISFGLFQQPDRILSTLGETGPRWLILVVGVLASLATARTFKWNISRLFELVSLVFRRPGENNRARWSSAPRRPRRAQQLGPDAGIARTFIKRTEDVMSTAAEFMEFGIILCAALDVLSVYVAFRCAYQVPRATRRVYESLTGRPRPGEEGMK